MVIRDILEFLTTEGISYKFYGNENTEVDGFSSLKNYKRGSIAWINDRKNIPVGFEIQSIALAFVATRIEDISNQIESESSKRAFFATIEHFFSEEKKQDPIGKYTYISEQVTLGKNVIIGHNCSLDGEIQIGDNTIIGNNVSIVNRVKIGNNCDIHSGVVIGHDGFAYTEDEFHNKYMIKHHGGVSIGNDVTIFDNVCITRGTIDDTVIEDGVKIDSLSHIAHNVHIRKNAALAAPCRLNGSVDFGEGAYIAGGLVRNQCKVGAGAFVGLGAVVVKDVEENTTVVGNPAKEFHKRG